MVSDARRSMIYRGTFRFRKNFRYFPFHSTMIVPKDIHNFLLRITNPSCLGFPFNRS